MIKDTVRDCLSYLRNMGAAAALSSTVTAATGQREARVRVVCIRIRKISTKLGRSQ